MLLTIAIPAHNKSDFLKQAIFSIKKELDFGKDVDIVISDIIGRIVLSDKMELSAGTHQFEWDASKLSSGIYFIRLSYGTHIKTQKALLVK